MIDWLIDWRLNIPVWPLWFWYWVLFWELSWVPSLGYWVFSRTVIPTWSFVQDQISCWLAMKQTYVRPVYKLHKAEQSLDRESQVPNRLVLAWCENIASSLNLCRFSVDYDSRQNEAAVLGGYLVLWVGNVGFYFNERSIKTRMGSDSRNWF